MECRGRHWPLDGRGNKKVEKTT